MEHFDDADNAVNKYICLGIVYKNDRQTFDDNLSFFCKGEINIFYEQKKI